MKTIYCILFAAVLCISVSVSAKSNPEGTAPFPQECVGCGFKHNCQVCVGGGAAVYCITFNCGACEEDGECAPGQLRVHSAGTDGSKAVTDGSKSVQDLKLSEKVIRKIGAVHPRFAITLAEMNGYGFYPGKRRVYWTPVELTSSDVEAFLDKHAHSDFFEQYNERARSLNSLIQKGEISRIVYAISVEKTDASWSIKMQVQGDLAVVDPFYSTLEIQVKESQAAKALGKSPQNKERWQIR